MSPTFCSLDVPFGCFYRAFLYPNHSTYLYLAMSPTIVGPWVPWCQAMCFHCLCLSSVFPKAWTLLVNKCLTCKCRNECATDFHICFHRTQPNMKIFVFAFIMALMVAMIVSISGNFEQYVGSSYLKIFLISCVLAIVCIFLITAL